MLDNEVKLIQYREKDKKMGQMLEECLAIRRLTSQAGAIFLVNDHLDLALLCQADGLQVGQDDLPVAAVRSLLGPDKIIGLSTHSPAQARQAVSDGVDYIGVGPIFDTATKKDVCAPVGLEYLDYVVANLDIEFVAIGGLKRHNLGQVVRHGARCLALVSEITAAPDIGLRLAEIRREMARAGGGRDTFLAKVGQGQPAT